jgi:uncharacterized protein (TIGR00251 family)
VRLALRVQPGAKRTALLMKMPGGEWKVAVSAPPVDGRANDAVVELVSDLLGVRRAQVTLVRGASARRKVVEIEGLTAEAVEQRLAGHLPKAGPVAAQGGKDDAGDADDE